MAEKLPPKYVVKSPLKASPGYLRAFRATQAGFDRDVELRLLPRPSGDLEEKFKRFRREVAVLAKLDHPSILRLLDAGYTATYLYYTTEFHEAVPLDEYLRQRREPLAVGQVLALARDIGSALAHCHAAGILHRNVSPWTLRWDPSADRPYLAEFSVVKDLEATASTVGGQLPGPIQLIATPELLSGRPYDARTDLYLFGATLYQAATGHSPLPPMQGLVAGAGGFAFDIQPPSRRNRALPSWFDDLVMKLLAQAPEARWPSAKAFLEALEAAAAASSPAGDGVPSGVVAARRPRSGVVAAAPSAPAPTPRRRWPLLAAPVAVLALAGAVLLGSGAQGPEPVPAGHLAAEYDPGVAGRLEAEVRSVAQALGETPIAPGVFLARWSLFRSFVLARPPERRGSLPTVARLEELKREFFQEPAAACRGLEGCFRAALL